MEAAKLLGLDTVPTLKLSHLSEAERRAYVLADNKLALNGRWDKEMLSIELQGLIELDFDVTLTGFSLAEVDLTPGAASDPNPNCPAGSEDRTAATAPYAASGQSPPGQTGLVGYGKPPEQHRFKKGVSGNPRGRPRKRQPQQASGYGTAVEEMLIAEAHRTITIRENGEEQQLPMIQAVLRSLGVVAVRGNFRAQIAITQLVRAVEEKRYEIKRDYVLSMLEFKASWQEEFDRCDRSGEPRPDPFPHPDDIQVDWRTSEVIYNGPYFESEKVLWERAKKMRDEAKEENADLAKRARRRPNEREFCNMEMAYNQRIIDVVENNYPNEATRRVPGFNIHDWRKRRAELLKLRQQWKSAPPG